MFLKFHLVSFWAEKGISKNDFSSFLYYAFFETKPEEVKIFYCGIGPIANLNFFELDDAAKKKAALDAARKNKPRIDDFDEEDTPVIPPENKKENKRRKKK